jgi:hypothetical protein
MKNLITKVIYGIAISCTILIGAGCSTELTEDAKPTEFEQLELDNLPYISHIGSKLVFDDFESFRSLVENDSLSELFVKSRKEETRSTLSISSKINSDENFPDGFLEYILNENNLVTIGDYTFQISLPTESVYAILNDSQLENSLILKDYSKKGIMKFSTSDDVLDLIENGYKGSPESPNAGIFCGGGCDSYDLSTPVTPFNPSGNEYYTRVRYVKAGIYFEVSYHVYMKWLLGPINFNTTNSPYSIHTFSYVGNCNSSVRQHEDNGTSQMMAINSSDGNVYNFKRTIYRRSEGLKKILLNVNFTVLNPNINVNSRTINCRF